MKCPKCNNELSNTTEIAKDIFQKLIKKVDESIEEDRTEEIENDGEVSDGYKEYEASTDYSLDDINEDRVHGACDHCNTEYDIGIRLQFNVEIPEDELNCEEEEQDDSYRDYSEESTTTNTCPSGLRHSWREVGTRNGHTLLRCKNCPAERYANV